MVHERRQASGELDVEPGMSFVAKLVLTVWMTFSIRIAKPPMMIISSTLTNKNRVFEKYRCIPYIFVDPTKSKSALEGSFEPIYISIFPPSIYIYGHSIGHEQNLDFLSYIWAPSWSCSCKSAFQTSNCTMNYPLVKTNKRMIGVMRIDFAKIYVIELVQGA